MNKILLIGPFPKPISGVSLANQVVKELLGKNALFKVRTINTSLTSFKEDIGEFSLQKFLFYLKINLKFYKIFYHQTIYITPGQTFFGVLKYGVFICLGALLKKEMIIHVHGNYLGTQYHLLSGIKKKIFHFLISKFRKGIVLSDSLKPNLQPFLNAKKIFSLPNFAQEYLISEEDILNTSELRIIYLSNLMKEKGILSLLDALQIIEKKEIKYFARIAGNIDENSSEEIKNKLNNLNNTTYIGTVEGNEKKELLNWGNIFVLPTYYKMEGQPIALLEAMLTSNIIITTNHAGILDICSEKNGFIVPKKSPIEIAKILEYLAMHIHELKDTMLYNSRYAKNNFKPKDFINKLAEILKK